MNSMDGRPMRPRRTTERHSTAAQQSERVHQAAPVTAHATADAPRTRGHHSEPSSSSKKRFLLPFAALLIVAALLIGGWFVWKNMQSASTAIDTNKYQAVFFTNGQVYFGKLQSLNGESLRLTDVFYLQANAGGEESANPQEASEDEGDVKLIKLGEEIHGPEDAMVIMKDQLLFYENLKTDGKVAQSIQEYKESQN